MKAASDPIYVQEFLFKESSTSQIFDGFSQIPAASSLLVADKKRGLLYIGHNDKITVLKPAEENNAGWKTELQLPGIISKIAINCDYRYVAIAIAMKPTILIYAAYSLARNSLCLLFEIGPNNMDSYVTDIRWNPTVSMVLCIVSSDYTISSYQLKEEHKDKPMSKLIVQSKASNELQVLCAAWSPKGKQIAVGCKNGDIIQLKPDLKIARTIAGPSPPVGEVISILWISNYQFCAAYLSNERLVNVLIVDAPKGEANATFTCYEDITYGIPDADGEQSVYRYYFEHVPEWGLIVAGSSNSSEIAVLGTTDGGANWNQWQLVDNGRAQLPLMRTTEIFPVGLAVDKSPTSKLAWGTEATLPHPVPILHILGTSGKLCSFHMVNLAPNCPVVNSPPTEIVVVPQAPPQPPTGAFPAEMSFNMNTVVTSTPRPKQPEVPERAKAAPITNIFGDSLKAAGFFQQQQQQPPVQPTEQPRPPPEGKAVAPVTGIANKPLAAKETPAAEPTKTEAKLAAQDKEASSPQIVEQRASIDDNVRMRAYLQEVALFEKEWRGKLESQVWECGTDEERIQLGKMFNAMEPFAEELKEKTNSLSNEITVLKTLLLQSFAWIEETKSKNTSSTSVSSRNCGENKIASLQRAFYYTQTQLNQVSKILDLEWLERNAQEMTKMKIPSMEFVYQNLLLHGKIIAKEKERLEQISRRWRSLGYSAACTTKDVSRLNRSMSSLHISLPRAPMSMIQGRTDAIDAHCQSIASKTLSFTYEKQMKLRALLTNSSPRIIKSVNPSPVQDRLKATLSSLASVSPATPPETKTKIEPPIVSKPSVVNRQMAEKAKTQSNPLASLNSIVARIGTSDANGVMQNKAQQKPASAAVSFPAAMAVKPTEKKPIIPTAPTMSQPKPKQDLNVNFPSITFGTPATKSQDIFFSKSPGMDVTARNSKESTVPSSSDIVVPKAPESALFSTGLLKDVLSTEYTLPKTDGIARSLPSLSATPAVKTDAAATFSFATPNAVPSAAKSSPATPLDAMMSFTYSKPPHTPTVESSVIAAQSTMQQTMQPMVQSMVQPTMQPTMQPASIELATLSLGASSSLNLQQTSLPSVGADGKVNTIAATMSFAAPAVAATQPFVTTAVAPSNVTIGKLTISLANASVASKPTETPVPDSVTIQAVTTPEVRSPTFGVAAPTSLPTASIFGGQTLVKNMATVAETPTTPPPATTTTFGAAAFPSIAPTFGVSTSAPTAESVFSGFPNMPTGGATTSSSVTTVSSSVSPFQSSLGKPIFGEPATSIPATNFGITAGNTSAAKSPISFGIPTTTTTTTTTTVATAASITPAFGKSPIASPAPSNAQFGTPSVQTTPASTANAFGKSIISPASTPFSNPSGSVFSNMPATSSNTPIFGGGSGMNSIFGSAPLPSTGGNIFGGNTTVFGTAAPSVSLFDSNASKAGTGIFGGATNAAAAASPFGNATSNASPTAASSASTNVFKSPATNTSPMGVGTQQPALGSQPVFGQAPAFGAKPMFGSPSMFGASKPVFGSAFGSPPTFESPGMGFGGASPMQGGPTMENVMPKVFGEVAGSSTFETLASQSGGLSFGSLAQKSPEAEKPAFTASSFSSWR
ncbi:PREDICTED: nuclear pore complex protein Nup214-like isoform X2 [Dinoponera quadriceps]|uniref:Nuclear pore complex protein Nup214-like isoform X2 n=1 Tax=Dinoponera quadriceps TaxID=609295 RepID=A0A6P3WST3_DINQU|nr:PREDICTED: nuclear pore complex protein Nup214-like isoform X2 [Dinoponera quadriceps]